ncbi:MAG: hypothetical protein HYX32_10675 [Actinobacteria bacterium]|nr:hypothetical protein [Actinomycetota bacterium]
MALYIPAGRRRRRLIVATVLSLVLGITAGWSLGRATAPSPADGAAQAKQLVGKGAGQLSALPLEYEKRSRGEIDKEVFAASLKRGLDATGTNLDAALAAAPWLDERVKQQLRADVERVRSVADRDAPPAEFDAAVNKAVADINTAFGSEPPG